MINLLYLLWVVVNGSKYLSQLQSSINPLMHNVPKWSDTLEKSCGKCCKIFKVCLTILGHYALNGSKHFSLTFQLSLLESL